VENQNNTDDDINCWQLLVVLHCRVLRSATQRMVICWYLERKR